MSEARSSGSPDVIIVGGGIVGCALAYDLTSRGATVVLVDRRELAREASWASAGIIVPPDPAMGARLPMALQGYRRYPDLVREVEDLTGIDTGFNRSGELMAGTAGDTERLRDLGRWLSEQGIPTHWVEGDDLRELEPALHDDLTVGLVTPDTASIRLGQFSTALAHAAAARGAVIREMTTVTGVLHESGRAIGVGTTDGPIMGGAVVVAAGAWSGQILDSTDVSIPTYPVMGQMLSIVDAPVPVRHVISAGGGYVVPRADGSIAIAATVDIEAGYETRVTPHGVAWLVDLIRRVAPALEQGTLASTWAGLRPASGDDELIIGRLPHLRNVWVATGHFRTGALLGPATSLWLAQSIVEDRTAPELLPFDPARFL